jgi:hypothetical protein
VAANFLFLTCILSPKRNNMLPTRDDGHKTCRTKSSSLTGISVHIQCSLCFVLSKSQDRIWVLKDSKSRRNNTKGIRKS